MFVRPQRAAAERHLPERPPDLPAMSPFHHPGPPPGDSRQDANASRFMHCSKAPMRSVDGPDRAFSRMLPKASWSAMLKLFQFGWSGATLLGEVGYRDHQNPEGEQYSESEWCSYQQASVHMADGFWQVGLWQ